MVSIRPAARDVLQPATDPGYDNAAPGGSLLPDSTAGVDHHVYIPCLSSLTQGRQAGWATLGAAGDHVALLLYADPFGARRACYRHVRTELQPHRPGGP